MARVLYNDPDILYDDPNVLYEQPVPESPQGIETWVTTPAGVYIAHLDRSVESPFREFQFSLIRNQPGIGSLEYHLDNALVDETPTLLDLGNLVWMRYRGRTMTWIIEDERAVLNDSESASDWRKVSGRGTLQLLGDRLVFPTGMANGANLDPSVWATQWRSFVNRAVGEMLWDMIVDTNARFTAQITRGTVETTGADGWTQDFRFENILDDVVKAITSVAGDVEMDGLEFNYYNELGTDKRATVIFEEGADLLALSHDVSDRERVSYIVGEGVGEGVFAKLAIAERADARRIEGFLAAKDAANLPLLQNLTDAALTEHVRRETVSFEVGEARLKAFTDFDIGDVVRAIAPSRGVDTAQRIDGLYVAEDGDKVRIALDLAGLRVDDVLKLDQALRAARSDLGVRNRQPQGQLVPFPITGSGVLDAANSCVVDFRVPTRIYVLVETEVQLAFSEYWAPATAASSGGGSTSGASSASSSASGGSSTPTSSSDGDSTPTTSSGPHVHAWALHESDTPGGFTNRRWQEGYASGTKDFDLPSSGTGELWTSTDKPSSHDHSVTIGAHNHSVTIGSHTHTIEHTHTTPDHTHGLTYTVYKETYPGSHSVTMAVYKRVGASWTLIVTISGLTDDIEDVDLSAYVDTPGSWRLAIQSAAAQPNNGRLAVNVSGSAIGAIKST